MLAEGDAATDSNVEEFTMSDDLFKSNDDEVRLYTDCWQLLFVLLKFILLMHCSHLTPFR